MKSGFLIALSIILSQSAAGADLTILRNESVCSFTTTVTFDYMAWYFRGSLHPMVTKYTCDGGHVRVDFDGAMPADIEEGHVVLQGAVSKVLGKFRKHGFKIKKMSESATATHVDFDHMKKKNETMVFSGIVEKN